MQDAPNSFWMASTPVTDYPEIQTDLKVDVAIVSGGIVDTLPLLIC